MRLLVAGRLIAYYRLLNRIQQIALREGASQEIRPAPPSWRATDVGTSL
jgi:hypothetical protein